MRIGIAVVPAAVILAAAGGLAAHAASAVAYDNVTGAWASQAQLHSADEARKQALIACRKEGGEHCRIVVSCEKGGYGRIYRYQMPGQTRVALGASCGWPSVRKAKEAAQRDCNRGLAHGLTCGAGPAWYDSYNDGHVPDRCKNAKPSQDPCYR